MLLGHLRARLRLHQCTSEAALEAYAGPSSRRGSFAAYLGIDPTGSSLHVGHLVGLVALRTLQTRGGFRPVLLLGGATALIGDPTGRSEERPELDEAFVAANIANITRTLDGFFGGREAYTLVNNRDWYERDMTALSFLRDIGRYFRVSTLLSRDAVKTRLDSNDGLSFTELSYQLLQANDFRKLFHEHRCVVQIGGSDQWGNIVSGVELIQRAGAGTTTPNTRQAAPGANDVPVGVTVPLVTVGGVKLGKTKGNVPVWLDAKLTTDFDFYQYFVRLEDEDAARMLLMLTEVEGELPIKERQLVLAREVTTLVRGEHAAKCAELWSGIIYGNQFPNARAADLLSAASSAGVQSVKVAADASAQGDLLALAVKTGIASSMNEARRLHASGALYINGARVTPGTGPAGFIPPEAFHEGRVCLLRSGKTKWGVVERVPAL